MVDDPHAAILEVAKRLGALQFGEFTLSSGAKGTYYFDGRLLTLDPEGASLIARAFMPILIDCGAEAIAGPTLGADPIVAAVAVTSHLQGHPIPGLIVRTQAKQHGTGRLIEGPLVAGARVAVVDDACTSGASLFHAIDTVQDAGCTVVKVLCILDRLEGGSTEIRRRGYDVASLLEPDGKGGVRLTSKGDRP
jgi:orotate phosphoribosyltransferase